ncbi:MAG: TrmH family RNA methyltransferase, partial [Flavobacteriales bacterium]|nr:TrmH family RNA methyltransferase [Flavobacteriales bacterium]
IARVRVHYTDLHKTLRECPLPIYGTFLHGENIYCAPLSTSSVIVIGNEANGISAEIEALVTKKITIPQFGTEQKAESLNAAMATAATLAIIRGK